MAFAKVLRTPLLTGRLWVIAPDDDHQVWANSSQCGVNSRNRECHNTENVIIVR